MINIESSYQCYVVFLYNQKNHKRNIELSQSLAHNYNKMAPNVGPGLRS